MIFVLALGLTIIVEAFTYSWFFKGSSRRIWIYSLLVNSLTLPVATVFYRFLHISYITVEFGVVVVESLLLSWLFKISLRRSIVIALVANSISAGLGLIISRIGTISY
jgi:hypothetical protein